MLACIARNQGDVVKSSAGWWNGLEGLPFKKLGQYFLEDVGRGNCNALYEPLVLGLSTMIYRYIDMMTIQSIRRIKLCVVSLSNSEEVTVTLVRNGHNTTEFS